MGRKKGDLNRGRQMKCPQCGNEMFGLRVDSLCKKCRIENKRRYHREYMKKRYYDKEGENG